MPTEIGGGGAGVTPVEPPQAAGPPLSAAPPDLSPATPYVQVIGPPSPAAVASATQPQGLPVPSGTPEYLPPGII